MMQTVTEPGGTATQAAILGYHVAGKTGTSRKASAGGYSRRYIGYFAGLVPVENPRFAMVVMVNDPGSGPQRVTPAVRCRRRCSATRWKRAAADGRGAGQPRDLAGRAGRRRGQAQARQRRYGAGAADARRRWREGAAMTRAMLLSELLPELEGLSAELAVTGLVQDSREVAPGDAFVAIAGFGAHGLHFVDAARCGPSAILFEPPAPDDLPAPDDAIAVPGLRKRMGAMADQFHGQPSAAMTTVGVTGTNGKTSTVQLLAQAWTLRGQKAGTVGTLGAGCGRRSCPPASPRRWCCACMPCWPSCATKARRRWRWKCPARPRPGARGRRALRRRGVHQPHPRPPRLPRRHGQLRRGQGALVRLAGPARRRGQPGRRVRPRAVRRGRRQGPRDGFSSRGAAGASVRAEAPPGWPRHPLHAACRRPGAPVRSPLLGRFNVDNLLAVAATLFALGMAPALVAETLSQLVPVDGRMNRPRRRGRAAAGGHRLRAYPDALEQALASLRGTPPAACCACSAAAASATPASARRWPRSPNAWPTAWWSPTTIRAARMAMPSSPASPGFADPSRVVVQRDRARAIALAIAEAGADDVVLVAGKGPRAVPEIDGIRHPFDDTEVARDWLRARGGGGAMIRRSLAWIAGRPAAAWSAATARSMPSPPTPARCRRARTAVRGAHGARTSTATTTSPPPWPAVASPRWSRARSMPASRRWWSPTPSAHWPTWPRR